MGYIKGKNTSGPHLFVLFHSQCFPEVADVVDALKLLDAGRQHHHEQRHQQVGMPTQGQVSLTAKLLKEDVVERLPVEELVDTQLNSQHFLPWTCKF